MRTIYIVDKSKYITSEELTRAVGAINRQLTEDYYPWWGQTLQVSAVQDPPANSETIVLVDDPGQADALGYHTIDPQTSVPSGIVFVGLALQYQTPWQQILSHEVLEQAEDWDCGDIRFVVWNGRPAVVRKEICDPVEGDTYQIDGVPVSNFVTPAWFSENPATGARFDFMGNLKSPLALGPGGYIPISFTPYSWINLTSDAREMRAYRVQATATPYSRTKKGLTYPGGR